MVEKENKDGRRGKNKPMMSDNVTNLVEFYAKEGAENKNC